jgi:CubicO group peptidase (beta-lactamase class C family)
MNRRTFLHLGIGATLATPLLAALREDKLNAAAEALTKATGDGQVKGASLYVRQGEREFAKSFGTSKSLNDMYLLGSISKPMSVAALMTLFDQGKFRLDEPAQKYLPEFTGDGREKVTIRHLLTHVSGLPDQLPENQALRSSHASLADFVKVAVRTPLAFAPGTRYQYSSMAILLASEIAQRISGVNFLEFIDKALFQPLGMKHSALGLGRFQREEFMPCQADSAAPESGSGDPTAKDWDWNSAYWRKLGAPWGGLHSSAPDVAKFLAEFLGPARDPKAAGKVFKPETARLMVSNQNAAGLTPRGIGFALGELTSSPGCSEKTFGHSGSTGTLCWADPATDTICVVLTTLPGRAAQPHPRKTASDLVAQAASS